MTPFRKNQVLSILLTGRTRFSLFGERYYLVNPTKAIKAQADNVYLDVVHHSRFSRWLTSNLAKKVLIMRGIISPQIDQQIKNLSGQIDDLKVRLFRSMYTTSDDKKIRRELNFTRNKLEEVENLANSIQYLTVEGYAARCKLIYLVKETLYDELTQKKKWGSCDEPDYYFIDKVIQQKNIVDPSDKEVREIARTNPWRSMWSIGKPNPLNVDFLDMGENQHSLYIYSGMYDGIRESMDAPTDTIINDDDLCDGWLVFQHRKHDKEKSEKQVEKSMGKNMQNSGEIFIPGKNAEDRKRIMGQNDMAARMTIAQRKQQIKQMGQVKDNDLVDKKTIKNTMAMNAIKERTKK